MQQEFMGRAIEIARQSLTRPGTLPYGSVVVKNEKIIGEGLNRAFEKFDPSSHGEVEAIRDACYRQQSLDLSGCELYTSCEPCSMCVATIYLAGIEKVYYASSLSDSAKFFHRLAEFDPKWARRISAEELRCQVGLPMSKRSLSAFQIMRPESLELFEEFSKQTTRSN